MIGWSILLAASLLAPVPGPVALAASTPSGGARPETLRVHIGPAAAGTSAFVALPSRPDGAPGIVVVHEWWGLDTSIRDVARRFARQGYVAIVPDLYHGKVANDPETAHILMRGLDEEGALGDLESAVAWLKSNPQTAKHRVGVVGFCMGGRLSQLLALRSPTLAAAVMFYGAPETRPERLATLKAPLQGHFGATDQGIDVSRANELRFKLKEIGNPGEVYVYAGAGHAFMNESRPSYQVDAARLAWARMLSFFQKYLRE